MSPIFRPSYVVDSKMDFKRLGFPLFAPVGKQHSTSKLVVLHSAASREEQTVALDLALIPARTKLETNGDGQPLNVSASETRTFLCRLTVTDQIEQESLDVSIWGSADARDFGKKPLLKLPQQFYRGSTKMVLDISLRPEVTFLRAKWELNRWGRVSPTPMFVAELSLEEIPPMLRGMAVRDLAVTPSAER